MTPVLVAVPPSDAPSREGGSFVGQQSRCVLHFLIPENVRERKAVIQASVFVSHVQHLLNVNDGEGEKGKVSAS